VEGLTPGREVIFDAGVLGYPRNEPGRGLSGRIPGAGEEFLKHATAAGLELRAEPTFLPYQYFLVLAPK
jgi:hypothetical protein